MTERELSLIRAVCDEVKGVIAGVQQQFTNELAQQQEVFASQIEQLTASISEIKSTPAPDVKSLVADAMDNIAPPELPDIGKMVSEAVAAIPVPVDGKSVTIEDVTPLLQQMVDDAVGRIPAPKDGKDYDPEVLHQAVCDAVSAIPVPADGKSVTVDDVTPMLKSLVDDAVANIALPEPPELPDIGKMVAEAVAEIPEAKPGDDGRDALQLEVLPSIDSSKSYDRGTYATHDGGLWRAYEKTHGMRGWECVVDGVATTDITRGDDGRSFSISVTRASGVSEEKTFDVPVMIYRGVFKSGGEYKPGDTVTWGGSLWHCDSVTSDKPGETGSKGWTLAAKRGRDGRDKP